LSVTTVLTEKWPVLGRHEEAAAWLSVWTDLGRAPRTIDAYGRGLAECQHRMACARCDFYTPKDSSRAQLLEAKANLQRMLVSIPLTDDERAAVDDGQTALDTLLDRLAEVPTPAGPSPRDLNRPTTAQLLPIIEVRQGTQR
jgi:hypothetical protein